MSNKLIINQNKMHQCIFGKDSCNNNLPLARIRPMFSVVFDLWLGATCTQCCHTTILKGECYHMARLTYWQYLKYTRKVTTIRKFVICYSIHVLVYLWICLYEWTMIPDNRFQGLGATGFRYGLKTFDFFHYWLNIYGSLKSI